MTQYIGCTIRRVAPWEHMAAARTAIAENPANAPLIPPSLAPMPPQHIAALTSRYWGAKGVQLTVQFLDGPDAETRRKILAAANSWGTRANVRFMETAGQGQVRIARTRGQGYYSYLGTDILHIPASECTMNLDSFTAQTPDSEYNRVVKHEFGHTLGWPHEHLRREIIARLDQQKTLAYFERTQGWSANEVTQQVLTPLSDSELTALPTDVRSIMCYELPAEITVDGQPIPGGNDIDDEDYQLAAKLYPLATTPQPPTPPAPPPGPPTAGAGEVLVRANLRAGWYVLYPGPPRGRFSSLQVIQAVAPGHFGLQAVPGSGLLQETGEGQDSDTGPVPASS